jgi:hypothetical protein
MCFLHARRSQIGAPKSVHRDKHGEGSGKEAETGRNKPAILPVCYPHQILPMAKVSNWLRAAILTTLTGAVYKQNRLKITPAKSWEPPLIFWGGINMAVG